jgi:RND family efflux transporter MFP subunit
VKRFVIGLLVAAVTLSACQRNAKVGEQSRTDSTQMAGMQGMPGMPATATPESSGVPIDRDEAARLGITFARAAERPVRTSVRALGVLKYAEPNLVFVNARVGGWVERLYADYAGKPVTRGEALLALYSPELVSAQEEYLLARRLNDDTLAASARRRLALWDVPADQIDSLEARGTVQRTLLLRAPRSGQIIEKDVIEGQAVQAGMNLFQIADPRSLWVDLAIFEQDAGTVRVGTPATLTVNAVGGRTFRGRVTFIYPQLDDRTRTLTARLEVENADGALRPGMYATAELATGGRRGVTVPLEAVLPTGTRDLVFVNRGDGRFLPREVKVGLRGDSLVEVLEGLKPGDEVVASATYLLDSESNLAAAIQGIMLQMGMGLNAGGMQMPAGEMKGMQHPAQKGRARP